MSFYFPKATANNFWRGLVSHGCLFAWFKLLILCSRLAEFVSCMIIWSNPCRVSKWVPDLVVFSRTRWASAKRYNLSVLSTYSCDTPKRRRCFASCRWTRYKTGTASSISGFRKRRLRRKEKSRRCQRMRRNPKTPMMKIPEEPFKCSCWVKTWKQPLLGPIWLVSSYSEIFASTNQNDGFLKVSLPVKKPT